MNLFVVNRTALRTLWRSRMRTGRRAGPPLRWPTASPDGRWIAYHRALNGQRDIWIIPADGGTPVRFTDDPATDIHPAWSPDQALAPRACDPRRVPDFICAFTRVPLKYRHRFPRQPDGQ